MEDNSDRLMFIKDAMRFHDISLYDMLYARVRDGHSDCSGYLADSVMEAVAFKMRLRLRPHVLQYDSYLADVAGEFRKKGYGDDRVHLKDALSGGCELHLRLDYRTWVINVEYGDVYALRWGSMKAGFWNLLSWGVGNEKVVLPPAETAGLLIEMDSYFYDIEKFISVKYRLVQKRMIRQKMDESLIVAALKGAGVTKYRLFSTSSVSLCLQVPLNSGKKAQIIISSKDANVIIPKLQQGLSLLINDGINDIGAYIYYD